MTEHDALRAKSRIAFASPLADLEDSIRKRRSRNPGAEGDLALCPQGSMFDEDMALVLGLLFRVLAPMRNRDNMRYCADGIEAMGREEAAYWLGMAMHRKNPRRVLMALRCLLVDPEATNG